MYVVVELGKMRLIVTFKGNELNMPLHINFESFITIASCFGRSHFLTEVFIICIFVYVDTYTSNFYWLEFMT